MTYKISKRAAKDLQEIWLYTLELWSIEQADRYVNLLFDEIEFLALNPSSGKDFSHVRSNYRCSKVKSHLIFYKSKNKQNLIEIIRVLHQKMDISSHLPS
jgi:toxin ParE1/3/4